MSDPKTLAAPFHYWKPRLYVGLFMLVLAFIGLIITEVRQDGAWDYWRVICIIFAVLSISLHIFLRKREMVSYLGTIWHEVFHWLGLMLCVTIISVMVEVGILGRFISSITILMLLALTTYLAGIYMEVTLVFVGIMLGLFTLGLSVVSAYFYPAVIPLSLIAAVVLWIYLKRKHVHHNAKNKDTP